MKNKLQHISPNQHQVCKKNASCLGGEEGVQGLIDQRQANLLCPVSGSVKHRTLRGFIREEMPSDPMLTAGPETGKGQWGHNRDSFTPHRTAPQEGEVGSCWGSMSLRWLNSHCMKSLSPSNDIIDDITCVRSLDTQVCGLENLIFINVLSSSANVYSEHNF